MIPEGRAVGGFLSLRITSESENVNLKRPEIFFKNVLIDPKGLSDHIRARILLGYLKIR